MAFPVILSALLAGTGMGVGVAALRDSSVSNLVTLVILVGCGSSRGWTQLVSYLWIPGLRPRWEVRSGDADCWEFVNQELFVLVALFSGLISVPVWNNSVHSGLAPAVPLDRNS